MKTPRLIVLIFSILFIILYLAIGQLRNLCISISYNMIFFIDNSLAIVKAMNPLIVYAIFFALIGACYGIIRAVKRFKLNQILRWSGFFGIFLMILVMVSITKPMEIGNSHDFREEMIWKMLNENNSYRMGAFYIENFPEGKHIDEVRTIQEQALWDSATVSQSSQTWDYYLTVFPNSERYTIAKTVHEALLYEEARKFNTLESFNRYLFNYPNGKYSSRANSALKRIKKKSKVANEVIVERNNDSAIDPNEQKIETQGIIEYPDGRRYEGSLKNGIPEGNGKEFFTDNTRLEGTWDNGKRHGLFIFYNSDGSTETQEFVNGNRIK